MSGPGAGLAGLLRGQDAGEVYCRCVLDKLAEQFSWKERRDLATSSVIERGGLMALGDSTYVRWARANFTARTDCSGAAVGGAGEQS